MEKLHCPYLFLKVYFILKRPTINPWIATIFAPINIQVNQFSYPPSSILIRFAIIFHPAASNRLRGTIKSPTADQLIGDLLLLSFDGLGMVMTRYFEWEIKKLKLICAFVRKFVKEAENLDFGWGDFPAKESGSKDIIFRFLYGECSSTWVFRKYWTI